MASNPTCPECEADDVAPRVAIPGMVFGVLFAFMAVGVTGDLALGRPPDEAFWTGVVMAPVFFALAALGWRSGKFKCRSCGHKFRIHSLIVKCPKCGKRLRGATSDMVGDTGVCPRCDAEFEITDS